MNAFLEEISIDDFDLSLAGLRISKPARSTDIETQMRKHGQLQPLAVRFAEGKYQIIDGFKRYYAAMELMLKTLQCYVLKVDLQQAKVLILSYNRTAQTMEVWEEAMILVNLIKIHGLSQKSLAEITGYSRSWVCRRLSLLDKLSEKLVTEIKMGTLSSTHARALIKLPRGNQMEMADVITACKLTSRQCDILVEAFLKAKDRSEQQQLLEHPAEAFIVDEPPMLLSPLYDPKVSQSDSDLIDIASKTQAVINAMLGCLQSQQKDILKAPEKSYFITALISLKTEAIKLIKTISNLQEHKLQVKNER